MLKRNVGTADAVLRILIGLGLLALVFVGPQTNWGYLGLILVISGLLRFCPAYRLLGLSTCPATARH